MGKHQPMQEKQCLIQCISAKRKMKIQNTDHEKEEMKFRAHIRGKRKMKFRSGKENKTRKIYKMTAQNHTILLLYFHKGQ